LLKHTSQTVKARVRNIQHRVNMQTLEPEPASTLELNSIGVVEIETTRPLFLDPYAEQRVTGSFILIDAASHATIAAGMVREVSSGQSPNNAPIAAIAIPNHDLLRLLETALLEAGVEVVRTRAGNRDLLQRLFQAGVVVLIEADGGEASIERPRADPEPITGLPPEPAEAVAHLIQLLNRSTR
jgi:sulfate adenylyltransferase subunit 1